MAYNSTAVAYLGFKSLLMAVFTALISVQSDSSTFNRSSNISLNGRIIEIVGHCSSQRIVVTVFNGSRTVMTFSTAVRSSCDK